MKAKRFHIRGIRPIRVLPLGFLAIILAGTLLLMSPHASVERLSLPFSEALFTATSATCVTGLIVVDTGVYFSLFGQVVLLLLIQIGGLGFMTMATLLFGMTHRRVSLHERLSMAEGIGDASLQSVVDSCRAAMKITFLSELIGAALLALRFVPQFGLPRGLWYSVFHSVSAFCNAGFDLFGGYRSLTAYAGDPLVLLTVMALIVTGGLGFAVIGDVRQHWRDARKMRLMSKLVLLGTAILIVGGAAAFLGLEYDNERTLGALPFGEKALNALFQSVTLRTAGFNAVDQASLGEASKGVGVLLMLAGGAPASTAGGLKITTILTLFIAVRAYLHGRSDAVVFGRTIPLSQVRRALTLFVFGMVFLFSFTVAISVIEGGALGIWDILYEATSAFCTVGVSVGVSGAASTASRMMLTLMMYIGRVGFLTLAMALTEGGLRSEAVLRYPREEVMIG